MKRILIIILFIPFVVSAQEFKKYHIWDEFYTEGSTIADVNKDGKPDIIAGARWVRESRLKPHDIWKNSKKFYYNKGYSDSFLNFATDVNEDGWMDMILFDFPGKEVYWLENPAGKEILWTRYLVDSIGSNESPMMVDINSDGKQDLVFGNEKSGQMNWWSHSVKAKKVTWTRNAISDAKAKGVGMFSHGLGWGDINNDGIKDVMIIGGWWEAPKDMKAVSWKWHEANLGYPCSQMLPYDLDGDGDTDVVSGSAHNYGLWWHEQVKDQNNNINFKRHVIDSTFSEVHSVVLKDVNNDGLPDIITGKRFFAHQGRRSRWMEPAYIYWLNFERRKR
ncbi:MAG: VCBS repeat-containing protein [Bacteroidota bacterium]